MFTWSNVPLPSVHSIVCKKGGMVLVKLLPEWKGWTYVAFYGEGFLAHLRLDLHLKITETLCRWQPMKIGNVLSIQIVDEIDPSRQCATLNREMQCHSILHYRWTAPTQLDTPAVYVHIFLWKASQFWSGGWFIRCLQEMPFWSFTSMYSVYALDMCGCTRIYTWFPSKETVR
jgi:hypothetical protein